MRSTLAILRRGLKPQRLTIFTLGLLVLGSGVYGWLRLPDSHGFYLVLQVVFGVLLLTAASALVTGTVESLARIDETWRFEKIWRRVPIGALVLIVAVVLYWLSGLVESWGAKGIYAVASWLSFHSNHPVPIPPFRTAWGILFLCVYLALLPTLAIRVLAWRLRYRSQKSIASEVAGPAPGSAADEPRQQVNFFVFWAVAIVLALVFDLLPWKLAWWVPRFHQGWAEAVSAMLRLGTAALAFACGLVIQWSWYIGSVPASVAQRSHPSQSTE